MGFSFNLGSSPFCFLKSLDGVHFYKLVDDTMGSQLL